MNEASGGVIIFATIAFAALAWTGAAVQPPSQPHCAEPSIVHYIAVPEVRVIMPTMWEWPIYDRNIQRPPEDKIQAASLEPAADEPDDAKEPAPREHRRHHYRHHRRHWR